MKYNIENIRDYIVECCECHYYYVENHMSLSEVSREVLLSPPSVKRRLDSLKDIDIDMYSTYLAEKKTRKAGRKRA